MKIDGRILIVVKCDICCTCIREIFVIGKILNYKFQLDSTQTYWQTEYDDRLSNDLKKIIEDQLISLYGSHTIQYLNPG